MDRLAGKVAIVTGAGREQNIGIAVVEGFLAAGARAVIATDVHPQESATMQRLRDTYGDRFELVEHDATDPDAWQRLAADVAGRQGGIDVLVNNAGISIHGGIADTSIEDLHKVMAVNHDAILIALQQCLPYLEASIERHPGGASVINTVSIGSHRPNPRNIAYSISKAAARMLTMCAARDLGPKRIRVNSVHPGVTLTPLMIEAMEDYLGLSEGDDVQAAADSMTEQSALGVAQASSDIAPMYVYLASDEARFVTGAAFVHDGGHATHF